MVGSKILRKGDDSVSDELLVASRVKAFIKAYMAQSGLKLGHLAQEIGYDQKRFSQLINGRSPMGIDDLARICRYFNVSADKFIPLDDQSA